MLGWLHPGGLVAGMRDTTKLGDGLSRHHHRLFTAGGNRFSERGQSLVEFALVLPMLLILLLGLADFGRVFAAGIAMEASARNAAEVAAQEYVQIVRRNGAVSATDYAHLHQLAISELCHEASVLPNYAAGGGACTMPVTAVCIHDPVTTPPVTYGPDPTCDGSDAPSPPPQCGALGAAWNSGNVEPGSDSLGYVEIRTCYRFSTLFDLSDVQLPFGWSLSLGDIYLQRTRYFTIGCYYGSSCR